MKQALDPELANIAKAAGKAPPPFSGTPQQARERMRAAVIAARASSPVVEVGVIEDRIAEDHATRVPVRIYRPVDDRTELPTVVFFHGGGFVLGSVDLADEIARKMCRDLGAVIVSVEYRLAPEHPFPAAHEDALAATLWAIRNVASLGGDGRRIAVAGESSGGNLAASTAIALRDQGNSVAAQLLIVPGVDLARDTLRLECDGRDYPMLTPADLRDIGRLYMGPHSARASEFPPSPMHASDLSGLPPTVIAIAGHDPLRDEGLNYARRLKHAGGAVEVLCFEDMFHQFFGFFAASQSAAQANDTVCKAFATLLHPVAPPSGFQA